MFLILALYLGLLFVDTQKNIRIYISVTSTKHTNTAFRDVLVFLIYLYALVP